MDPWPAFQLWSIIIIIIMDSVLMRWVVAEGMQNVPFGRGLDELSTSHHLQFFKVFAARDTGNKF